MYYLILSDKVTKYMYVKQITISLSVCYSVGFFHIDRSLCSKIV